MPSTYRGFSLIELMIVIVIIGILAGVSLPSYQAYLQKAKFSQIITLTQGYKLPVSLGLQQGYALSALNSGEHGIPTYAGNNDSIHNIVVSNGVITATATEKAGGYTYVLTPNSTGSEWAISGTCVAANVCGGK